MTPDYGWLSEESADDLSRLGKRRVWIVDPIDGTRGYLAGHDDWCVSVALVEGVSPLLAAVFAPATDEFFLAERGQGTSCNGVPVRATPGDDSGFFQNRGAEVASWKGLTCRGMMSSFIPGSVRWRCGCAGWRTAGSMRPSPAARAVIGTSPLPI